MRKPFSPLADCIKLTQQPDNVISNGTYQNHTIVISSHKSCCMDKWKPESDWQKMRLCDESAFSKSSKRNAPDLYSNSLNSYNSYSGHCDDLSDAFITLSPQKHNYAAADDYQSAPDEQEYLSRINMPKRRLDGQTSELTHKFSHLEVQGSNNLERSTTVPSFHAPFCEDNFPGTTAFCLPSFQTVDGPDSNLTKYNAKSLSNVLGSTDILVVDCRYPYEYEGGHIKGSVNIYDNNEVKDYFFPDSPERLSKIVSKTPIFYCEHSNIRSPRMATDVRNYDRLQSLSSGRLLYKKIGLLEQGYKRFYEAQKRLCEPEGYVSMLDGNGFRDVRRVRSVANSNQLARSSTEPAKRSICEPVLLRSPARRACSYLE